MSASSPKHSSTIGNGKSACVNRSQKLLDNGQTGTYSSLRGPGWKREPYGLEHVRRANAFEGYSCPNSRLNRRTNGAILPTAPQGAVSPRSYLKTEKRAASNWQVARRRYLVLGIWYLASVATLCLFGIGIGIGIGFGSPLGHPRATQGPPKGHPSVAQASIWISGFVCNRNGKRPGGGRKKTKNLPLINTDDADRKKPNPQENTAEGGGATRAIPGVESCKSLFFGVDPGEGGTLLESLRAKTNRPRFHPGACGRRACSDGASNRLPDLCLPARR